MAQALSSQCDPDLIIFTDASNGASGVVCFDGGWVCTLIRIWTPHEASLHMNTKEALASWLGVNDLRTRQLIKDPNSGR